MKKYICLILISLLVLTSVFTTTFADNSISVTIDGKTQTAMVAFHKGYDNVLEIVVD